MAGVKDESFEGQTVEYNDVVFGGSTSEFQMQPPEYSLKYTMVYDDADRTVTHLNYFLTVQTVVFNTSAALVSADMEEMRKRLATSGKTINLDDLGIGFNSSGALPLDIIWGVKPRQVSLAPIGGRQAWELIWVCEFNISPQASGNRPDRNLLRAWNFSTTWDNDFEGQSRRTISGYYEIVNYRLNGESDGTFRAENNRPLIKIAVPLAFRRISNTWRENSAKDRVEFNVVDEQFEAEAFPAFITAASGTFGIGTVGVGFAKGIASLDMSLTTAPGKGKNLAGIVFFRTALNKQAKLTREMAGSKPDDTKQSKGPTSAGMVIASALTIRHHLWTRRTDFSMQWALSGCINKLLFSGGIWQPVPGSNYAQWLKSVSPLWENRGNADNKTTGGQDLIIDVTDRVPGASCGVVKNKPPNVLAPLPFKFACPDIPKEQSWFAYDVEVEVFRTENRKLARKAISAGEKLAVRLEGLGARIDALVAGVTTLLASDSFIQSESQSHVVEEVGFPTTVVALKFRGLRVQHLPVAPKLVNVDGQDVTQWGETTGGARQIDRWGCHPLYFMRSTQLYTVASGYVSKLKTPHNPTICGSPILSEEG